jgi:hypothetical protein
MSRENDQPDHEPEHEPASEQEPTAQQEKLAWDAIVADLTGTLDIGDLVQTPDPVIDELLEPEGDYEPPHPPPLKAPADTLARFAWAGALGGPVFVVIAYVMDLGTWLSVTGVIASVAGFVTLVARMPHERDPDDDGAVV